MLYPVKRKEPPLNRRFDPGTWKVPVLAVAIGAVFLGFLMARRGRHGLVMPHRHSIDTVLDRVAGTRPS